MAEQAEREANVGGNLEEGNLRQGIVEGFQQVR
jgi:hypothetical protein